jgi:phasin family protein
MAKPHQEDKSAQSFEDAAARTSENAAAQTSRIGQAAAEQTGRVGQAAADAAEEVARVGANLLQQNAQTLQNTWRTSLEMATAIMGRSTDQLGRTLGLSGNGAQKATERSARNAETVLYASTAATKVMDGMSREYFELVRHQMEKSMDRMTDLWSCRTPQDVAAIQSDLVRETVASVLESSRRMADMSLKLADDAANHMTQSMERIQRAA